jgi:hypothetical protein
MSQEGGMEGKLWEGLGLLPFKGEARALFSSIPSINSRNEEFSRGKYRTE